MKYRKLGSNGIKVSVISLGGWLTYGFNVNDENANKSLDEALNQGINFIDVADAYNKGESESAVGRFMKQFVDAFPKPPSEFWNLPSSCTTALRGPSSNR